MRYAKLQGNVVIQIISGERPDNTWVDYPDTAPRLSMDYRVVYGPGGFTTEPYDLTALVEYDVKRLKQYPPIGDQLDALWKALDPLITHPEARAILNKIQEIKSTYPKT